MISDPKSLTKEVMIHQAVNIGKGNNGPRAHSKNGGFTMKIATMMAMMAVLTVLAIPAFADSYISVGQQNYADIGARGGEASIYGDYLVEGSSSSINGNSWVGIGGSFQSDVYGGMTVEGTPTVTGMGVTSISSYNDAYAYQGERYSSAYVETDQSVSSFSAGDGFAGAAVSSFGYADSSSLPGIPR